MMKQITNIFVLVSALLLAGCSYRVVSMQADLLPVDNRLDAIADSNYVAKLAPIKAELELELNRPLGFAPEAMSPYRPESPLSNWASDALQYMAEQWVAEQGEGRVDFTMINMGGLRCEWPAGDITFRNVFELMPFDNEMVILTLSGESVLTLVQNCRDRGGECNSKELRITPTTATVRGQKIDPNGTYYVVTSDYLSGGADGLTALTYFTDRKLTGKKMRDLYIQYIQQVKTVQATTDGRMQL